MPNFHDHIFSKNTLHIIWCCVYRVLSLILCCKASMHQIQTRCRMSMDSQPRKLPRMWRPRRPVDCEPLLGWECFMLFWSFFGRKWLWLKNHLSVSCLVFFEIVGAIAWVNYGYLFCHWIFSHDTKKYLRWRASRSSAEPTLYSLSTRWDVHFELGSVQFIGCPNQVGLSSWNCVYTMLSHRSWIRAWCQASELGQRVLPSSCRGQPRGFGPSGSKDAGTQRKRPAQSMWTNQKNVGGGFQTESVQAVYGVQQWLKLVHQEIFDKEGPWEGIWAWGVFWVQNRRRASRQIREALLQMVQRCLYNICLFYCMRPCIHDACKWLLLPRKERTNIIARAKANPKKYMR